MSLFPQSPNVRKYLIVLCLVCVIIGSVAMQMVRGNEKNCKTHHDTYEVLSYKLDNRTYHLLLADTPTRWEYGLMNVKSKNDICENDGMIFTFPTVFQQAFWNKNTLVDLDVYWIKDKKILGKSYLPAITKEGQTTISSPGTANVVIEIIR